MPAIPCQPGSPPTAKQRAVYEFVERYIRANGYPPAYRDICEAFGWASPHAVRGHVQPLIKKGWLRIPPRPAGHRSHSRCLIPTGMRVTFVRPDGSAA